MSGTLVIRLKGMGDIVHAVPSLKVLRQRFPGDPLALLCQKPFGEVVPESLNVELMQIPARAGFWETLHLLKRIRGRRFDRLIDFFCNPRTALLSALSGIPHRMGFDYRGRRYPYHERFSPVDPNLHLSELFGEFLSHFRLGGEISHPEILPPEKYLREADRILSQNGNERPLLGVNPHATYPSKAWPLEHFASFLRLWYRKMKTRALIFWGPGEEKDARRLLALAGEETGFLHPPVSVKGLMALISRVDLFLTGDTGPMNIAWALKVPTTALFGPTTRKAVAPRGPAHLSLYHETLDCLQCHKETCDNWLCMPGLKPEWVFQKMEHRYPEVFQKP